MQPNEMLVWCDLETTGLKKRDKILEIAVVLTDNNLIEISSFESLVLGTAPANLVREREVRSPHHFPCYAAHFENGLIDALFAAEKLDDEATVERKLLIWLGQYGFNEVVDLPSGDKPPLCGSSVWFDRGYLERDFPSFLRRLSHTQIDVSSFRRAQKMWAPDMEIPEKKEAHRALDDIRESIGLLRFYRRSGFVGY